MEFQQDVSHVPSLMLPNLDNLLAHVTKRYMAWREIWRNDKGERDRKFETFGEIDLVSTRKVHRQLALMAQALFDVHAMEDDFGIKPPRRPERVRPPRLMTYKVNLT